ncbi:MAG: flagellar export protein FliJ [Syntrophomonadaceae bacterium]|nr:flagellar export protein FliJ [Syntrophomonadaceae bacterium]
MRRFKFRLQTSLNVALMREDIQRQELDKCQTAYQEGLAILQQQQKQYALLVSELRDIQRHQLQIETVQLYQGFMLTLDQMIKDQNKIVNELYQELEQCRIKLLRLMRNRKVLEKLKERYWFKYQREVMSEEQKQNDELAIIRFASGVSR